MKNIKMCSCCKEKLSGFFLYCPRCGACINKAWMEGHIPKLEEEDDFALHTEYFHGMVCGKSREWENEKCTLHHRFGYCKEYLYERVEGSLLRYHPNGEIKRIHSDDERFCGAFAVNRYGIFVADSDLCERLSLFSEQGQLINTVVLKSETEEVRKLYIYGSMIFILLQGKKEKIYIKKIDMLSGKEKTVWNFADSRKYVTPAIEDSIKKQAMLWEESEEGWKRIAEERDEVFTPTIFCANSSYVILRFEYKLYLGDGSWEGGAYFTYCIHPETGEWDEIERYGLAGKDEEKIYSFDMKNNLAWCRIRGTECVQSVNIYELPMCRQDVLAKERNAFVMKDMEDTFYFDGEYQFRGDTYHFCVRKDECEEYEWNHTSHGACCHNIFLGDWIYVMLDCFLDNGEDTIFLPRRLKLPEENQWLVITKEQKEEALR